MKFLNEALLDAWLALSIAVNNEKMVSEMPYNEALICNILYRNQRQDKEQLLTATDLCRQTKMLKSQMNRTLQCMEEKDLITRSRSSSDKRRVFITLNTENRLYQDQHQKILNIADTLIDKLGSEKAMEIADLFTMIADTVNETMV